jgi:hypothetical protein
MNKSFLLLSGIFFLGGCAQGFSSYVSSIQPDQAPIIAKDVTEFIRTRVNPYSGPLQIEGPGNDGLIAPALRKSLVSAGYKISNESPKHQLAYQIAPLDRGVIVRLYLDGSDAARYYRDNLGSLSPSGPFSFREAAQ